MNSSVKNLYLIYFNDVTTLYNYFLLAKIEHLIDPDNASLTQEELDFFYKAIGNSKIKKSIVHLMSFLTKNNVGKLLVLTGALGFIFYIANKDDPESI